MAPVQSSNVSHVGYDAEHKVLSVRFKSNPAATFHYKNCTPKMHRDLMGAESKGGWIAHHLVRKPNTHPVVKEEAKKK